MESAVPAVSAVSNPEKPYGLRETAENVVPSLPPSLETGETARETPDDGSRLPETPGKMGGKDGSDGRDGKKRTHSSDDDYQRIEREAIREEGNEI